MSVSLDKGLWIISQQAKELIPGDILTSMYRMNNEKKVAKIEGKLNLRKDYFIAMEEDIVYRLFNNEDIEIASNESFYARHKNIMDCTLSGPRQFPPYCKKIVQDVFNGVEYDIDTCPQPPCTKCDDENIFRTTKISWGQDIKKLCGPITTQPKPVTQLRPRDESLLARLKTILQELKARRTNNENCLAQQVLRPDEASSNRTDFLTEDRLLRQFESSITEVERTLHQHTADFNELTKLITPSLSGQMDSGKDMSIVPDINIESTQSVELVNQAPQQQTSDPRDFGSRHAITEQEMDTLEQMANRWFPLTEFVWQTEANGTKMFDENFPSYAFKNADFLQSPNATIFKNFRFFRFDVEFEIVVNCSKMQAGALLCSWRYLDQFPQIKTNANFDDYMLLTQGPHSFAFAGRNTVAKLIVPYKNFVPMLATTPSSTNYRIDDFFNLKVHVYNYLRGGDNCNDPVNVNVFMRFKNLRKAGLFGADGAMPVSMSGQIQPLTLRDNYISALAIISLPSQLRLTDPEIFSYLLADRFEQLIMTYSKYEKLSQDTIIKILFTLHRKIDYNLVRQAMRNESLLRFQKNQAKKLVNNYYLIQKAMKHLRNSSVYYQFEQNYNRLLTARDEELIIDEEGAEHHVQITPWRPESEFLKNLIENDHFKNYEREISSYLNGFNEMQGQMDLGGALKGALTGGLEGLLNQTNSDQNRDRPSDPRTAAALVPYASHSWANGDGTEITNILRLQPSGQTPHFSSEDEMQAKFVTSTFSAIDTFTYRTTDGEGTKLATYQVHPIFPMRNNQLITASDPTNNLLETYRVPALGVIASNFAYWKGSIEFRFDFIVPFSNTGRIMIAYIPTYKLDQSPNVIAGNITYKLAKSCYNSIFDLGEQTSITFNAPFYTDRAWLKTDPTIMETSGVIAIFVVNRLVRFCNSSQIVDVNTFVRSGSDFELSIPVKPHVSPAYQRSYIPPSITYRTVGGPAFAGLGDPSYQETVTGITSGPVIARSGPSWSNWVIYRPTTNIDEGTVFAIAQDKIITWTNYEGATYNFRYGVPLLNINGVLGDSPALALFQTQQGARDFALFQKTNKTFRQGPYVRYVYSGQERRDTDGPPSTVVGNTQLEIVDEEVPQMSGQMDDRRSTSIFTNPGSATKHSSQEFYNESFTDLKTLARRYQFYADYERDIAADTCFGRVLCRVPVRPLVHEPPLTGGDQCALQMFNAVRAGFIATLGSGYRFFKGSLRFKIIFDVSYTDQSAKDEHDDLTFMITHVPDKRPLDYITTPSEYDITSYNPQGYAYYGHSTKVNPICEIEIPYYSRLDYITPQKFNPNTTFDLSQDEFDNLGYFDISLAGRINKAIKLGIQVYYAFGDDARFSSFQGFPSMILLSDIPKSVTSQATNVMTGQGLVPESVKKELKESAKDFTKELADTLQTKVDDATASVSVIASEKIQESSDELLKHQSILANNMNQVISTNIEKADLHLKKTANETINGVQEMLTSQQETFFKSTKETAKQIVEDSYAKCMEFAKDMGLTVDAIGVMWFERVVNIVTAVGHIAVNPEIKTIILSLIQILNSMGLISGKFIMNMYEKMVKLTDKLFAREASMSGQSTSAKDSEDLGLISTFATAILAGVGGTIGLKNKRVMAYSKDGLRLFREVMSASNNCQVWLKNNVSWLTRFYKWINIFDNGLELTEAIGDDYKEIRDWLTETHNLVQIPIHRIEADLNMVLKVYTLAWKAESFITMECKEREKLPIHHQVRHYSQEISKIRDQLLSSSFSPSIGVEPFAICLTGPPGFGKSELLGILSDKLLTDVGYQTTGNTTYVRGFTSYWNNAGNQPGVVIDEIGMNEDTTKQIVQELFAMKSRSVFNPEFAHLEDKRRVFNPSLIVMASNYPFWDVLPTGVCNIEALHRRRDALWEVEPQFPIDPKNTDLTPYEQQVEAMKALKKKFAEGNDSEMTFTHLKFRLCVNPEAKTLGSAKWYPWISYDDFYKINLQQFMTHRRKEIKMVKSALDRFFKHRISYFSGMKNDDYFKSIRDNLNEFKSKILNNPSAEAGALLGTYNDPSLTATVGRLPVGQLGHASSLEEAYRIADASLKRFEEGVEKEDEIILSDVEDEEPVHSLPAQVGTIPSFSVSNSKGKKKRTILDPSTSSAFDNEEEEWNIPVDDNSTIPFPKDFFKNEVGESLISERDKLEYAELVNCPHLKVRDLKPTQVLYKFCHKNKEPTFLLFPFEEKDAIPYKPCESCFLSTKEGKEWKDQWSKEVILTKELLNEQLLMESSVPPEYQHHFKCIARVEPCDTFPALTQLEKAKSVCKSRLEKLWDKLNINWKLILKISGWFSLIVGLGTAGYFMFRKPKSLPGNLSPQEKRSDKVKEMYARIFKYYRMVTADGFERTEENMAKVLRECGLMGQSEGFKLSEEDQKALDEFNKMTEKYSKIVLEDDFDFSPKRLEKAAKDSGLMQSKAYDLSSTAHSVKNKRTIKGSDKLLQRYEIFKGHSSEQTESIKTLIQENMGILKFTLNGEDCGMKCHYVGLYGRVSIFVRHQIITVRKMIDSGKDVKCFLPRKGKDYEFDLMNVDVSKSNKNELILIELPSTVPEFRDIRSHIATETTTIPSTAIITYISGKQFQNRVVNLKRKLAKFNVVNDALNENYPCDRTLVYDFGFPGLCCAPILSIGPNPKILGFHIAGSSKEGASQQLYRSDLPGQFSIPDDCLTTQDRPQIELPSCLEVIGILDKTSKPGFSDKTQLKPSLMHNEIFESTKVPAPLRPVNGLDPMALALKKLEITPTGFDPKHLDLVRDDLIEDLMFQTPPIVLPVEDELGFVTNSLLTLDEVFSGIPGMTEYKKLNLATSEGYPFCILRNDKQVREHFGSPSEKLLSGKHWLFDYTTDEEGYHLKDGINSFHPLLRQERENMFRDRMKRIQGDPDVMEEQYAVLTLKDQKISKEKAAQGKNRIFSACPVEQSIAVREYFGHFKASYMANRINNSTAIGIDVNSPEWSALATKLKSKGDNIVTGDYAAFGDTLDNDCVRIAFEAIIEWYDRYYPSEKWFTESMIRIALYEEMREMPHIARNVIFKRLFGIPSGFGLTVEINDLVNKLYMKLAWLSITKRSLREMKQHVYYCMYGDDMILSVTDEFKDIFNFKTIQEFLQKHNIRFTPATKDERIYETIPLSEATFLKSSFVEHPQSSPLRPIYYSKLPIESVLELLNWQWVTNDDRDFCYEACRTSLQKLFTYGKKEFDFWRTKMFNFFVKHKAFFGSEGMPHLYTFEELETKFLQQFT